MEDIPLRRALLTLFLIACCTAASLAAGVPEPAVSIDASDIPLATVAKDLSASAHAPVVLGAGVTGNFSGTFNNTPLDTALDFVAKASSLCWQKVFVPATCTDRDALAQAQAQVAVLNQVKAAGPFVVYDPAAKQQITLAAQPSDASQADQDAAKLGLKAVYLLSLPPQKTTASSAKTPSQEYSDLARQQKDALLQMSPADRVKAMQQAMMDQMGMDPNAQVDLAEARIEAKRALKQSNPAGFKQLRQMNHQVDHQAKLAIRQQGYP